MNDNNNKKFVIGIENVVANIILIITYTLLKIHGIYPYNLLWVLFPAFCSTISVVLIKIIKYPNEYYIIKYNKNKFKRKENNT